MPGYCGCKKVLPFGSAPIIRVPTPPPVNLTIPMASTSPIVLTRAQADALMTKYFHTPHESPVNLPMQTQEMEVPPSSETVLNKAETILQQQKAGKETSPPALKSQPNTPGVTKILFPADRVLAEVQEQPAAEPVETSEVSSQPYSTSTVAGQMFDMGDVPFKVKSKVEQDFPDFWQIGARLCIHESIPPSSLCQ